ncbi:hypothetical protein BGW80DRAFT_1459081 [Lactifluus volemus]|nr:hypothetical protein BGW80DRAFT_1459081 [Lactifluus volemus]
MVRVSLLLSSSSYEPIARLFYIALVKSPTGTLLPPVKRGWIGVSRRKRSYAAPSASSEPYDAVGERGPGNPLFPSNFAKLALGPTLTANNPALRSRDFPPAPAFSNPHAIRAGVLRGRRDKPSWADDWDPLKHEYAVTASEGSVGGH